MIIGQNTTNKLNIPLKLFFSDINWNNINKIVIIFGTDKNTVQKRWDAFDKINSTMDYNRTNASLLVTLSQAETKQWNYQIPIQIRIKTKDGTVTNSKIFYGYINPCLSNEEL